ncbi:MAG: hydrogen gas-evolving membrane-bound hydrogenase subunit E, partial [Chloroflexota bacterium]
FAPRKDDHLHYHAMPALATVGPMILAVVGTFTLPFLLDPIVIPLMEVVTPKPFELYLMPPDGLANPYLQLSIVAIFGGLAVFFMRESFAEDWQFLPFNGAQVYAGLIKGLEDFADYLAGLQNGKIRYYLFYILGVVAVILISSPIVGTLVQPDLFSLNLSEFTLADSLNVMLLILGAGALLMATINKRHLIAALALGVFGYSVAGIFIVNAAPDVALVQFLVETLATVLIIVMISRISHTHRKAVADDLWGSSRGGVVRDALISFGIGFSVFVFALTSLSNRAERTSISQWHIDNTFEEIGITDVVSAILTDFRGMDTLVEIIVFAMCALGILSLLALNRKEEGVAELPNDPAARQSDILVSTPFTRTAAYVVFPLALLISVVHMLYGAVAPGDGFTSGIVGGLALALGYVIFGYYEIKDRIRWLSPQRFIAYGLLLALVNGGFPILVGHPSLPQQYR